MYEARCRPHTYARCRAAVNAQLGLRISEIGDRRRSSPRRCGPLRRRQAPLERPAGHADLRGRGAVHPQRAGDWCSEDRHPLGLPAALTRPPTELPTSSMTAARAAMTSPLIAELVATSEAPAEIVILPVTDARSRHVTPESIARSPLLSPAIVFVQRSFGMTVTRKLLAEPMFPAASIARYSIAMRAPARLSPLPRLRRKPSPEGCRRSAP